MRLRELKRTAVFAWSPGASAPLIITGTKTGALGDDFSSETKLEVWDLGLDTLEHDIALKQPLGSITTDAGFNDVAWSQPDDEHPLGVIAGALENGSVDLWDAEKLRSGDADKAFVSRTTKHSGAVKALQWNPYRHNLLASVGAKGEIFIYDLNNMANPFRLGASAARADDIECLDWNKQEKTAHILATGSSGGFVTVWDVKQKRDILTLNNQGRKAVSAVAWDPYESTKLATATPNDQDPVVLLWSLRNSSVPERTLKGHELGVLGLSWCLQDPELLLSCGKDNHTICWNPKTGEKYGDFAAGSNWAFQTKWNPHNPNLIASASFAGKILITTTQSTNSKPEDQAQANQQLDGEDFFAKAQTQPQGISFSLPKAPAWMARPSSVSFGFGGKLVRVGTDSSTKNSKVSIETFSADSSVGEAAKSFEDKLRGGDLESICASKIEDAKIQEEKADWRVIETLNAGKSRKKLREYLGFGDDSTGELAAKTEKLDINGTEAETNGDKADDFFGNGEDDDSFLADLAATKGAKTNNPFSIYTGSESDADKIITRALMLGQFEKALDACLQEDDRIADAFMIAVCGGQKCTDKVQNAYLKRKQAGGPNYLRLLASIVGKNLWDVVHNADLQNWKDVMATLCTYADETEFADLCEALGDRLEEAYQAGEKVERRDASFCYLAGSKLEKVVRNWVQELKEQEKGEIEGGEEGEFEVHARCLQKFVEKVSVFRKVTGFRDAEMQSSEDWKLAELYTLYSEYADILAAQGQLGVAEQYLNLLPSKFSGAEAAQQRVKQAGRKGSAQQRQDAAAAGAPAGHRTTAGGRMPSIVQAQAAGLPLQPPPLISQARNATPYTPATATPGPYAPTTAQVSALYAPATNSYTPAGYQPAGTPSFGSSAPYGGGYQPPQQQQIHLPPPPRANASSPSAPPPSLAKNTTNWNDMPDNFFKDRQPNSRRGTPVPQPVSSPFPNAPQQHVGSPPPPTGPPIGGQHRTMTPLPPPPKAGEAPPRMTSPPTGPPQAGMQRPSSGAASAYAPIQSLGQAPTGSTLPPPAAPPPVPRGASPYQPPPSTSFAAPSNRYAPAPGSHPSSAPGVRQVAPNPYAAQQQQQPSPYAPQQVPQQSPYGQPQGGPPPPSRSTGPPLQGPPRSQAPPIGSPPQGPPRNITGPPSASQHQSPLPTTAADAKAPQRPPQPPASTKPTYPRGDRSHIPPDAQPIVDILTPEIARIKAVSPPQYKPKVDDMEKRINILFDHLNNDDLGSAETVPQILEVSRAVEAKDWERAQGVFREMEVKGVEGEEGRIWMVSFDSASSRVCVLGGRVLTAGSCCRSVSSDLLILAVRRRCKSRGTGFQLRLSGMS